jgi:hypothetical protein
MALELDGSLSSFDREIAERLETFATAAPADLEIELVSALRPEWSALRGNQSVLSRDGASLSMRYGGWYSSVDLRRRRGLAYIPDALPSPQGFDSFLKSMAQLGVLVTRRGVAVHGAALEIQGVAVVLAAPSQTGKSTMALRAVEAGATLLAEDLSLVGGIESGTPAIATSPIPNQCGFTQRPREVPLAAIYGLERGREDEVAELEPRNRLATLLRNVSIGTRQRPLVEEATRCVHALLAQVAVRRLTCRSDGAVYETILADLDR